MINFLKNIGLASLIISGLTMLGLAVNSIPIWGWVTNIFVVIRVIIEPVGAFWHMTSLLEVIGYAITLFLAYWVFQAYLVVNSMFRD